MPFQIAPIPLAEPRNPASVDDSCSHSITNGIPGRCNLRPKYAGNKITGYGFCDSSYHPTCPQFIHDEQMKARAKFLKSQPKT